MNDTLIRKANDLLPFITAQEEHHKDRARSTALNQYQRTAHKERAGRYTKVREFIEELLQYASAETSINWEPNATPNVDEVKITKLPPQEAHPTEIKPSTQMEIKMRKAYAGLSGIGLKCGPNNTELFFNTVMDMFDKKPVILLSVLHEKWMAIIGEQCTLNAVWMRMYKLRKKFPEIKQAGHMYTLAKKYEV